MFCMMVILLQVPAWSCTTYSPCDRITRDYLRIKSSSSNFLWKIVQARFVTQHHVILGFPWCATVRRMRETEVGHGRSQSRAQSSPAPRSAVGDSPLTEEPENSGLEIGSFVSFLRGSNHGLLIPALRDALRILHEDVQTVQGQVICLPGSCSAANPAINGWKNWSFAKWSWGEEINVS